MSEQTKLSEPPRAPTEGASEPPRRAVSDPREVVALVRGRVHQVKARKEEMGAALDELVDITQQLTRAYGAQLVMVEQLRRRVKSLEDQMPGRATLPRDGAVINARATPTPDEKHP
jgi:hypothetical protein